MPLVVQVPLNTMLADLDESLRSLLKKELERHGFDGVEIAFEAPSRDWSGQLSAPCVNMFLYDLRESGDFRPNDWDRETNGNGHPRDVRPPLVMEASYAVTAWTQAVEDEHRLLSQVLGIFYAFPELPADILHGRLANGSQRFAIAGKIGQPKGEGKADFWSAVGGQYKVSLDYVVSLSLESGTVYERGPEVRSQTMATMDADVPRATRTELHRFGGKIADGDGNPLADAWITLPESGQYASSDPRGRFIFNRIVPGKHKIVARTRDGAEVEAEVEIPGANVDLVVGGKASRKKA
jgi:Pvc16 N-terminal domain